MSDHGLTHLDEEGRARMVDVGAKENGERRAVARARLRMSPATARAVEAGDSPRARCWRWLAWPGCKPRSRPGR